MMAVSSAGSARVMPRSNPARYSSLMSCPDSGRSPTKSKNSSRSPTAPVPLISSRTATRWPRRSTVRADDEATTCASDADREETFTTSGGAAPEVDGVLVARGAPSRPSLINFSKRVRIEFISKRSKKAPTATRSQPPNVRLSRVKSSGTSRTRRMTTSFWRARCS